MQEGGSGRPEDQPLSPTSSSAGPSGQQAPFIAHQVTKLDTLAGLAVRYHVSVSDIKRANGLLSDSAMYAKDRLFIPTQAMPPMGVEYSTWAGMIVTQYGRIPGSLHANGMDWRGGPGGGSQGESPPKNHSAALDQLQRYYGTGETHSEPEDFRPGSSQSGSADERMARLRALGLLGGPHSSIEIEMTELEHGGASSASRSADAPGTTEYAGSRGGPACDERLRRRKGSDGQAEPPEPASSGLGVGPMDGGAYTGGGSLPARPPVGPRLSPSMAAAAAAAAPQAVSNGARRPAGRRRDSIVDRIRRAASQPSLAGLKSSMPAALGSVPSMLRTAEAFLTRSGSGSASLPDQAPDAPALTAQTSPPGGRSVPRVPSSAAPLSALLGKPSKKD